MKSASKSKIIFVLSVFAFVSPVSVLAMETKVTEDSADKILCAERALKEILKANEGYTSEQIRGKDLTKKTAVLE